MEEKKYLHDNPDVVKSLNEIQRSIIQQQQAHDAWEFESRMKHDLTKRFWKLGQISDADYHKYLLSEDPNYYPPLMQEAFDLTDEI